MSQDKRLDFVNSWPNTQLFPAEERYRQLLSASGGRQLFTPHKLAHATDRDAHITISYFIDALSSLPNRPDHAFDWIWRALESIVTSAGVGNITSRLRSEATPQICGHLRAEASTREAFFRLIDQVPFQVCEYLFKQIANGRPYSVPSTRFDKLSKLAKRLLLKDGSGSVESYPLQFFLSELANRYSYDDDSQRRNGAALLRLVLQGHLVQLGGAELRLEDTDRVFLLLSGLAYSYRNDRAHANSIAPFQSSYASLKTYAHCWFMFLFVYQCLIVYLRTRPAQVPLDGDTAGNFRANTDSFVAMFAREIKQ